MAGAFFVTAAADSFTTGATFAGATFAGAAFAGAFTADLAGVFLATFATGFWRANGADFDGCFAGVLDLTATGFAWPTPLLFTATFFLADGATFAADLEPAGVDDLVGLRGAFLVAIWL